MQEIDTTGKSLLHRLAGYGGPGAPAPKLWRVYLLSVTTTFVPLLIAAAISGLPLWKPEGDLRLPFLRDWNMSFAFLVSFPMLMWLVVTDEHILTRSLRMVQRDGVIALAPADAATVTADWKKRFRRVNLISAISGLVVGTGLTWLTLQLYLDPHVGFWIVGEAGRLVPAGYVYLFCITLLYALITIYVVRGIWISRFLRDLVAPATIHLLPFHPDKCGGLRPVGQLGLRNQYTLTVLGINIVILVVISVVGLHPEAPVKPLLISASAAYLVLGPVVFMGPLLPFRAGMLRAKEEWSSEVSALLRQEFTRLRVQVKNGGLSKSDEELIDRLRKLGSVVDELPVWPFDARTLRRFATAYVAPVLIPVLGKAGELVLSAIGK